jgi:hypothetical protein
MVFPAPAPVLLVLGVMLASSAAAFGEELGEPGRICTADSACTDGRCLASPDDPKVRYCTKACDLAAQAPCPTGPLGGGVAMVCRATTEPGLALCVYDGAITPGGVGWPCSGASECLGGFCSDDGRARRCTRQCFAFGGGDCPLGTTCQPAPEAPGTSVCLAAPPGGGWCGVGIPGADRKGRARAWSLVLAALLVMLSARWARRSAS